MTKEDPVSIPAPPQFKVGIVPTFFIYSNIKIKKVNFFTKDIKSALEFAHNNKTSDINDWMEHHSSHITEDEIVLYDVIKYDKFNLNHKGKEHEFYIFHSNQFGDVLKNFKSKFLGYKGYYEFSYCDSSGLNYTIFSFDQDFFNLKNWDNLEDFDGIRYVSDEKLGISFYDDSDLRYDGEFDDRLWSKWGYEEESMEKNKTILRLNHWYYPILVIDDIKIFDFKSIESLFKKI